MWGGVHGGKMCRGCMGAEHYRFLNAALMFVELLNIN
jgi:hypothetical protein